MTTAPSLSCQSLRGDLANKFKILRVLSYGNCDQLFPLMSYTLARVHSVILELNNTRLPAGNRSARNKIVKWLNEFHTVSETAA